MSLNVRDLQDNEVTGALPSFLGSLSAMEHMYVCMYASILIHGEVQLSGGPGRLLVAACLYRASAEVLTASVLSARAVAPCVFLCVQIHVLQPWTQRHNPERNRLTSRLDRFVRGGL